MKIRKGLSSKFLLTLGLVSVFQFACQRETSAPAASSASSGSAPTAGVNVSNASVDATIYEGIEFDMPKVKETKFPNYRVPITKYGAVGDGITKNTKAFEQAIADVAAKGGGRVVIPRGLWLTGPIVMKSNIDLHAEAGSMVIFSRDFDDYPVVETSFEGLNTFRCQSPISGRDLENIAITGEGTFDGNGDAWRPVKKSKMTAGQWKELTKTGVLNAKGDMWYPTQNALKGDTQGSNFNVPDLKTRAEFEAIKDYLRPVMLSLVNCKRVLLDGPTFQNSPAWNLHPLMCQDIIIRNLNVRNPWYSQNGDGLDLESCKNALVYNNTFDVGDDAICFKSGKDKDGRDRGVPTENVIVKNNVVYHGHGGFVVGSEMSGGVRNVHVSNCTFMGTDIGLRFKSTRGRGGLVENIWISNIDMVNIPTQAISFNLFYGGNSPVLEDDQRASDEARVEKLVAVTEETPSFKNIWMRNITVSGAAEAVALQGLPEMNLQNVNIENSYLKATRGISAVDATGITLKNVKVITEKGPALTIYNSKDVKVQGLTFNQTKEPAVKVMGPLTKNVKLESKDFASAATQISKGKELNKAAVLLQ
ncbi:glycoside hydrolase family 28 protein [Rufibacter glacialis]|uniref:Glycoside hydrolase family 28 protein n=1 Tax=Rufibacter glacialis TaxID=1259555 RepID=A0A5M8Q758_9BACT|nr:glycoside hydrolase family 28 protein [Rufibacter glacialis]KAA6430660.1 glycoside hydrolase family 28 protein [Rufibacter glacialis]GGK85530.1 glycoside hydrolase [Rufibacter glacialis]